MCDPAQTFLTSKISYLLFFPITPIKLKLGLQIGGRQLIATHFNQSKISSQWRTDVTLCSAMYWPHHLVHKCKAQSHFYCSVVDEEKWKHAQISSAKWFGPRDFAGLVRLVKVMHLPEKSVINIIWLLFPVSHWSIIMIGDGELLLIVSHLFAVSVFILGLRLKKKTRLNWDVRNIVARSPSEHLRDCSKDWHTLGEETHSDDHYIKGARKIWYLQSWFDHNFSCANWLVPHGSVNKWYSTRKLQACECMPQFGR